MSRSLTASLEFVADEATDVAARAHTPVVSVVEVVGTWRVFLMPVFNLEDLLHFYIGNFMVMIFAAMC